MIVVKIEMWPGGNESQAREIGRAHIANVPGPNSTATRGDYRAHVCRKGSTQRDSDWLSGQDSTPPTSGRTGEVKNYPRLSYNVWRLIIRALRACFPEEK